MLRKATALLLAVLLCAAVAPPARAARPVKYQKLVVQPGDTLWSIARKWLKDPQRWSVILKHNRMPTKDPTVPLPGMTLKVPIVEVKESLRAAKVVEIRNKVNYRKRKTPSWERARKEMELFDGDALRTLKNSSARVEFFRGAPLHLNPNSMAILKHPKKADHDILLQRGSVLATRSVVQTPSARVVPRGKKTQYTARVMEDLSTRVQVFKGAADVQDAKGLKSVSVPAGFATDIPLDRAPTTPSKIPDVDEALQAVVRAASPVGMVGVKVGSVGRGGLLRGTGRLAADLEQLSVGIPVAAYHVQAANDRGFSKLVLDRDFHAYEKFDLKAVLPAGKYWARSRVVDLLGDRGRWTPVRALQVGGGGREFESLAFQGNLEVLRPETEDKRVQVRNYRIMGRADPELTLRINGRRIRMDMDGNFSHEVRLEIGANEFRIKASDVRGNEMTVIRRIFFERLR